MKLSLTDETRHLQDAMAEEKASSAKQELGLEDCRLSLDYPLELIEVWGIRQPVQRACAAVREGVPVLVVPYN